LCPLCSEGTREGTGGVKTTGDRTGRADSLNKLQAKLPDRTAEESMADDREVITGELTIGGRARGFTIRLPREAGGQVAVLAAVAGGLPASLGDVTPSHAVSAMLIHGTADRRTAPSGRPPRGPGGQR
jgi:polyhydroxybutyrate depolymerase